MLTLIVSTAAGAVGGTVAGGLLAWLLLRRQRPQPLNEVAEPPIDPWLSAEIDQAAATWAAEHGRSEQAASLLADKLHLLHRLGARRWRP